MSIQSKIQLNETAPLKRAPLFGVFVRWPEDGEDWIHPLDIGIARHLLPGNRVFRRVDYDADYYRFIYGELSFRARPRMWILIENEGFEVGDSIEIRSQMGKNWPMLAYIKEIVWNHLTKQINYLAVGSGRKIQQPPLARDIHRIPSLNQSCPIRWGE